MTDRMGENPFRLATTEQDHCSKLRNGLLQKYIHVSVMSCYDKQFDR